MFDRIKDMFAALQKKIEVEWLSKLRDEFEIFFNEAFYNDVTLLTKLCHCRIDFNFTELLTSNVGPITTISLYENYENTVVQRVHRG